MQFEETLRKFSLGTGSPLFAYGIQGFNIQRAGLHYVSLCQKITNENTGSELMEFSSTPDSSQRLPLRFFSQNNLSSFLSPRTSRGRCGGKRGKRSFSLLLYCLPRELLLFGPSSANISLLGAIVLPSEVWRAFLASRQAGQEASLR